MVDTATDENDGDCGDGDCSLRDAIQTAAGGETIYLSSTLTITKEVTIDGSGQTITVSGDTGSDGDRNVQVFYIDSSGVVTLSYLNVVSGTATNGGGIYISGTLTINNSAIADNSVTTDGGGIYNAGTLTVNSSAISGNSSTNYAGGGILNAGTLTVNSSTISGNSTNYAGGGIYNNNGVLTIIDSAISGNSATGGGGISSDVTLTVRDSTLSGNSANWGGGIYNWGTAVLINTTIVSNTASNNGGGIYNGGSGVITLANSIAAYNGSGGDCHVQGGSIVDGGYNLDSDNICGLNATGSISNTDPLLDSLANNGGDTQTHALQSGSPALDQIPDGTNGCGTSITTDQRGITRPQNGSCDMGAYELEASAPSIIKSVDPNTAYPGDTVTVTLTLDFAPDPPPPDILTVTIGSLVGANINYITGATTLLTATFSIPGNEPTGFKDVLVTYPAPPPTPTETISYTNGFEILGMVDMTVSKTVTPATVYPGDTITYTLTFANAGNDTAAGVVITDTIPAGITVQNVISSGDVAITRTTIQTAEVFETSAVSPTQGGLITLTARVSATASAGQINNTAVITAASEDKDPANNTAQAGLTVCDDLTVTTPADSGPGSLRQAITDACDGATIIFDDNYTIILTSALTISRELTIDGSGKNVTVSGNNTARVFYIDAGGVATLSHLTVVSGTAGNGGGIRNDGDLTVNSSTFSGNSATGNNGGGINNVGTLVVNNSTFSNNSAGNKGGGLRNNGTLTVTNSTLSDNSAGQGSGIYNESGATLNLQNTIIANSSGGGDCTNDGAINDNGYNLDSDNSCGLNATGSITNTNPQLDPLADNGGDTQTHALQSGSPALD